MAQPNQVSRALGVQWTKHGHSQPSVFSGSEAAARSVTTAAHLRACNLGRFGARITFASASGNDQPDDQYTFPDLMMRMRARSELASNKYLHIWLISPKARQYFQSKATGTQGTMPKINQDTVRATPVLLPPLAEQRHIVAKVEELRGLYADLRKHLRQAKITRSHLADTLVTSEVA